MMESIERMTTPLTDPAMIGVFDAPGAGTEDGVEVADCICVCVGDGDWACVEVGEVIAMLTITDVG